MKKQPLVLTFDIGTQSARALLVDAAGTIVSKVQQSYEKPYYSLHPGWAEQQPAFYWDMICKTAQALKAQSGALWGDVIAVTCTTIRDTSVCMDSDNQPVRDAILWLDKREAKGLPPIPVANKIMFKVAGLSSYTDQVRRESASNWLIQNEPETWRKTSKFVLLSAYFNFMFTGRLVDSIANIIGHLPFDAKYNGWVKSGDNRRCLFNIENDKLCELVEAGTELGGITPEAARATGIPQGTPFIVTGSDKGCETLGLSCLREDSAAISFATIASLQVTTDRYFEPKPFIPPYPAVAGGYNPEVETYRGYWLISWFKKEFASKEVADAASLGCSPEDLLNQRLQEIPPGCEGLMLQPTFTGNAITPHAKGAIIGFSDAHTRIHIYRAIVEGVNFSLIEGLREIERRGKLQVKKLFVAGGGSRSAEICQITANMFGLPVYRTQTHEACGIGSSMVAFVSSGIYKDYNEAAAAMVHIRDEFVPDMAEHALYRALFEKIYCQIFNSLAPLYKELNGLLH